jgi:hypothetical protein
MRLFATSNGWHYLSLARRPQWASSECQGALHPLAYLSLLSHHYLDFYVVLYLQGHVLTV